MLNLNGLVKTLVSVSVFCSGFLANANELPAPQPKQFYFYLSPLTEVEARDLSAQLDSLKVDYEELTLASLYTWPQTPAKDVASLLATSEQALFILKRLNMNPTVSWKADPSSDRSVPQAGPELREAAEAAAELVRTFLDKVFVSTVQARIVLNKDLSFSYTPSLADSAESLDKLMSDVVYKGVSKGFLKGWVEFNGPVLSEFNQIYSEVMRNQRNQYERSIFEIYARQMTAIYKALAYMKSATDEGMQIKLGGAAAIENAFISVSQNGLEGAKSISEEMKESALARGANLQLVGETQRRINAQIDFFEHELNDLVREMMSEDYPSALTYELYAIAALKLIARAEAFLAPADFTRIMNKSFFKSFYKYIEKPARVGPMGQKLMEALMGYQQLVPAIRFGVAAILFESQKIHGSFVSQVVSLEALKAIYSQVREGVNVHAVKKSRPGEIEGVLQHIFLNAENYPRIDALIAFAERNIPENERVEWQKESGYVEYVPSHPVAEVAAVSVNEAPVLKRTIRYQGSEARLLSNGIVELYDRSGKLINDKIALRGEQATEDVVIRFDGVSLVVENPHTGFAKIYNRHTGILFREGVLDSYARKSLCESVLRKK